MALADALVTSTAPVQAPFVKEAVVVGVIAPAGTLRVFVPV